MRKLIFVSALALAVLVALVPISNAEMAKEGTDSSTNNYTGTYTVVPLDKERYVLTYETSGINISDTGKGPFHYMGTRNIGVIYLDKGVGKMLGYVVMTDQDSDKVLVEIKEDKTLLLENPRKGTGKFIGGTGKFAGIEGTLEYTRYNVEPPKYRTSQGVVHVKSHWKLPETNK